MSHVDPFNALGGFSVGIPPELVIDETGNVVNNVNAPEANVTANRVYANYYYWANGVPFTPNATASGSNTQVQYNNNGNFGASSAFTFNSSTNLLSVTKLQVGSNANLGNVANVVILGGTNGYFLQTDGAGNLTWAAATGNGGNGTPGGANTQVQFNDAGAFGGDAGFTYNKITNTLTTGNIVADYIVLNWDVTANVVVANYLMGDGSNITNVTQAANSNIAITVSGNAQPNITSLGTLTSLNLAGNITNANAVSANLFAGNGSSLFGIVGANVNGTVANANFAAYAGNVTVASQPNITSLGNLTNLVVTGNTALGNNVTANFFTGNLYGLANLAKNVTLAAQPNITSLGTLTTLAVSGNTNLGITNTTNLFANNFTVESTFTTLGNVVAGNVYANTGNIRANLIIGTLTTGPQPNITSVGVLTNLAVSGNVTAGNANLGNLASANFITGTLTTNAQPNINFVGNLGWLNVQTGILGSNGNITFNGSILGNGSYSNISITGNLNAGNYVQAERLIGSITSSSQPNITSVGNLTSLTVVGNTNLGGVGNITITGGNANYVLSTDGAGNLSWVPQTGNGGSTIPGGLNTYIQFNDNGSFGGDNTFTWNKTTEHLYVGGTANFLSNVTAPIFVSNVATGTSPLVVESTTPVANLGVATAATVRSNAQPNITSVGTLSNLTVSGDIITGNISSGLITGTLATNSQPNITSLGILTNLAVSGTSNLGLPANVKITGGTNGYVLSTDGLGNLSWVAQSGGGGNGTPGGSNTQVQFNNAGSFGGSPKFTWNDVSDQLTVTGNLTVVNNFTTSNLISTNANVTTLTASGNISAGNVSGGNLVSANFLSGTLTTASQLNINYLGNVGWLNVDTALPNANGNITFNGSITGLGAASNITITGNVDAGNFVQAERLIGTISTAAQPNITSVGNLTSLTVVGNSNFGNAGNITILGGNANYVLSTDGAGNLSWIEQAASNATVPGGLNTYIQFNDNGNFAGDNAFTWNKINNVLFVGGDANISNNVTAPTYVSNVATGVAPFTVNSTTPVANLAVETAATVRDNAQPNITSVGTLTSLTVSGNINTSNLSVTNTFNAGNITTPGTIGTTNLNVTGTANFSNTAIVSGSGTLTINGKFNSAGSSNVNLGNISNVHISGGINGYVLATDGNANLYWTAGGGGGNGSPGGSNTQVQYNDNGTFAGSAFFTFNENTSNVQIAGNLIANSLTIGAGIYEFSHSNVYFATTISDSPNQTILSVDADDLAGLDLIIISTDNGAGIRNIVKISTVIFGNVVNYVEYSTLPVNGYIGDFTVSYDAGNIITPASVQLKLSPQTANFMTHKMSVTRYKE
jgi:hypothetical protein